jgi:hypothetical protein
MISTFAFARSATEIASPYTLGEKFSRSGITL